MNILTTLISSVFGGGVVDVLDAPPSGDFTLEFLAGDRTTKTLRINNPNSATMTINLDPWKASHGGRYPSTDVAWVALSNPITISAGAYEDLDVACTVPERTVQLTFSVIGTWSVAGGSAGEFACSALVN